MDSTIGRNGPCAEIPVVNDLARQLVEGPDNRESLDFLFPIVVDMAKEMQNQKSIKVDKLYRFNNEKDYNEMRLLFHTFNRKTLRSLVLGTIPYDLYDEDSPNWSNVYNGQGAGSYLVGLSVRHRKGAFFNRTEIELIIDHVRRYKEGCEAWSRMPTDPSYSANQSDSESDSQSDGQPSSRSGSQSTSQSSTQTDSQIPRADREALVDALTTDNEVLRGGSRWTGKGYQKPAFVSGRSGRGTGMLIDMLSRRLNDNFNADIYQLSSPVYIGCTYKVAARMPMHNPDSSNMSLSSSTLKLLIACARREGIQVLVHTIPIVLVWHEDQVRLSEILVTVLAQSLLTMNGLNIIQPGTSRIDDDFDPSIFERTKEHVWVQRGWYGENLQKSFDTRHGRDILEAALAETKDFTESVERRLEQIDEGTQELEMANADYFKAKQNVETIFEQNRTHLEELSKLGEMAGGMLESDSDNDSDSNTWL
ncbi:hypothetical protein GGS26DRAFT_594563 [Hypomontagnella submonticulosa]|nr:hypothetical protein GGS26DRAFT_594563 [Hypomontagnella submonticulosa]